MNEYIFSRDFTNIITWMPVYPTVRSGNKQCKQSPNIGPKKDRQSRRYNNQRHRKMPTSRLTTVCARGIGGSHLTGLQVITRANPHIKTPMLTLTSGHSANGQPSHPHHHGPLPAPISAPRLLSSLLLPQFLSLDLTRKDPPSRALLGVLRRRVLPPKHMWRTA